MRLKSVVLILVALGIAGGTAQLVRGWIARERAAITAAGAKADQPPKPSQVLVARNTLAAGHFIRPEDLGWQAWPVESIAPMYVLEGSRPIDGFVGTVVRTTIAAGEPITDGRLVSPGNSGFLAAVLQPGYRAVSVPVTITSGISGFVFPGDRVDMILTHVLPQEHKEGVAPGDRRASETVLRDIRVLAIDQKVESKQGEPLIARTATLEVTPKQGEIIAVVVEMGKLSLSLRSFMREPGPENAADRPKVASYTLDSEASRLLGPPQLAGSQRRIHVLRAGKAEETVVQR